MPISNPAPAVQRRLAAIGRRGRLALAVLLGLVSAFSFAPFYLWPLMAVALCGLLWLADTSSGGKEAAACGWCFGFAHFATGLYWVAISFQFQEEMPDWIGWAAVAALSAYLALYPALALWLYSKLASDSPLRILVFAASWTLFEWLRGHLIVGFPWNSVAQIWSATPVALQSARWFGAYGLSFVTIALFCSVSLFADWTRFAGRVLVTAWAVAALMLADGLWRLPQAAPGRVHSQKRAPGHQVHLVQPNIAQDLKRDPERQLQILESYESLTRDALRERGPGIVIWPETAVQYDVEGDGVTRLRLGQLLGSRDVLILGAVGRKAGADGQWVGSRNSLVALRADGTVAAIYDKRTLVPFGEYLPGGGLLPKLGLTALAAGRARFVAGPAPATLSPGTPPFSPLICFEIIFPGQVVAPGPRPAWLLNISNDAWFGNSSGPHQHLAQARLRAVEEGLPVVRSTPTGISAVIDPYGRLIAAAGLGRRAVVTADIPAPVGRTPYSRSGDWPTLLILAACFLVAGGAKAVEARGGVVPDALRRRA